MGIPGSMHGKEIRPAKVIERITHDEGYWHEDTPSERADCDLCNP